uniref:Uncharacterized protein n=1 Tax=Myotis myotis TaxID=51298 RepID=A0A7J7T704_MYOMY|nr:hypothetical protein mMyoMyo1_009254 [Myotis myotis]
MRARAPRAAAFARGASWTAQHNSFPGSRLLSQPGTPAFAFKVKFTTKCTTPPSSDNRVSPGGRCPRPGVLPSPPAVPSSSLQTIGLPADHRGDHPRCVSGSVLGAVVAGQAGPPSPAPFSLLLSSWPGLGPLHRQFSLPRRVLRVLQVDFFKYQRTYPSYDIILYFSHGVFENMGVSCLFICPFILFLAPHPHGPFCHARL